ncbi:MAG: hypothetical protein NVSMB29_00600 [Candidatus Dormibacteria bacterium]
MLELGQRLFGVTWDHRKAERPHGPQLSRTVTLAVAAAAAVAIPLQASAASPALSAIHAATGKATAVIVRAAPAREPAAEAAVLAAGGRVGVRIGLINGFAATVPQAALSELRADSDILGVTPNATGHLLGTSYDPSTDLGSMLSTTAKYGAQAYWSSGFTGSRVDVALIDSGVAHVDGLTAPGKLLNGPDLSSESNGGSHALDTFGHGTHMAGIIAGRDNAAAGNHYVGDRAHFLGMAPDARLVSVKVANATGDTNLDKMLAAIDWVVQHRHDQGMNIRVLNLSFGVDTDLPYTEDPLALAVEAAWHHGVFVSAAAGNDGIRRHHGLADPAYDPTIMAVGASQSVDALPADDLVPAFSSRASETRNRRPDLVAPGTHIQSLRAPGSFIDRTFGATGLINDRFFRGSGTSQAAAAASGAAALIFSQHPDATPDQVKDLLTGTATHLRGVSRNAQGSGVISLSAALHAPITIRGRDERGAVARSSGEHGDGHEKDGASLAVPTENSDEEGDADGKNSAALALPTGSSWSGSSWSGGSWSGSSWSGSSWSGSSWSGSSWSGSSWSGSSWSGSSWSGSSWSGSSWSGGSWSCLSWLSANWG